MADVIYPGTLSEDDISERARRAVAEARKMQLNLSGFARMLTGKDVKVQFDSGTPRTNGKTIYLRPPIELGDKLRHDKESCKTRDFFDVQRCDACRVREDVLITLYHEVAHIAFDSFEEMSDDHKREIIARAVREAGADDGSTRAAKIAHRLESFNPRSYIEAAAAISPFLPIIVNAYEDVRVNLEMYTARPGTLPMFRGQINRVFSTGIENADGTMSTWCDQPKNSQIIVGLLAKGAKYDFDNWFSPEVVDALNDPELSRIVEKLDGVKSVQGVYELAFPTLERIRQLGFCKAPDEPEDDPVPEPTPEPQPAEPDDEDTGGDDDAVGEPATNPEADESQPGNNEGDEPSDDGESSEDDSDESGGDDGDTDADESDEDSSGDADGDDGESDQGDDVEADNTDDEDGDGAQSDELEGESTPGGSGKAESDEPGDKPSENESDGAEGGSGSEAGKKTEPTVDKGYTDPDDDFDDDDATDGEVEGDDKAAGEKAGESGEGESESDDDADSEDDYWDSDPEAHGDYTADSYEPDDVEFEPVDLDRDGTPDDAARALRVFGGHEAASSEQDEANQDATEDAGRAMGRAIAQDTHFLTPSDNIDGVRVHKHGEPIIFGGRDWSELGWPTAPYELQRALEDIPGGKVGEAVIAPALLHTRRAFADNRATKFEGNLKHGRVNARVLGRRIAVDDPRLFAKKTKPNRKDYFVVIGMDISGSAAGWNLRIMKNAVMAQAELLNRLGIKFAVYGHTGDFHTSLGYKSGYELDIFVVKDAHENWTDVTRHRLASLQATGANIDGHTLEFYRRRAEESTATDKIIMYYTDGAMPLRNYVEERVILEREIAHCRGRGITLMGVGVLTDSPIQYGLDTVQIDDVEDVPKVVAHLEKRLRTA